MMICMGRAIATKAISLPRRLTLRRKRSPRKVSVCAAVAASSPSAAFRLALRLPALSARVTARIEWWADRVCPTHQVHECGTGVISNPIAAGIAFLLLMPVIVPAAPLAALTVRGTRLVVQSLCGLGLVGRGPL